MNTEEVAIIKKACGLLSISANHLIEIASKLGTGPSAIDDEAREWELAGALDEMLEMATAMKGHFDMHLGAKEILQQIEKTQNVRMLKK